MTPDPLKEWYADASKQTELRAVLESPILKEAMTLLQTVSLPRPDYVERASAEAITNAAMEFKRNTGFFSYPSELWQLTEKPEKPPERPSGYSDSYVKSWAKDHGMWEEFDQPEQ
jgi:hypothetical protein